MVLGKLFKQYLAWANAHDRFIDLVGETREAALKYGWRGTSRLDSQDAEKLLRSIRDFCEADCTRRVLLRYERMESGRQNKDSSRPTISWWGEFGFAMNPADYSDFEIDDRREIFDYILSNHFCLKYGERSPQFLISQLGNLLSDDLDYPDRMDVLALGERTKPIVAAFKKGTQINCSDSIILACSMFKKIIDDEEIPRIELRRVQGSPLFQAFVENRQFIDAIRKDAPVLLQDLH